MSDGIVNLSCVMPTLHNGPDLPHWNCPFPGGQGMQVGSPSNTIRHWIGQGQPRALQNVISIQSSCLSTAHKCDRHTRRTDEHSCSSLELEAVGLRSISFLVPNLVEFSSRNLKVLTVSAFMTPCDKWFQFCSTRWVKKFCVGLVTA